MSRQQQSQDWKSRARNELAPYLAPNENVVDAHRTEAPDGSTVNQDVVTDRRFIHSYEDTRDRANEYFESIPYDNVATTTIETVGEEPIDGASAAVGVFLGVFGLLAIYLSTTLRQDVGSEVPTLLILSGLGILGVAGYYLYQAFDTDDGGIRVSFYTVGGGVETFLYPRSRRDFAMNVSKAAARFRG